MEAKVEKITPQMAKFWLRYNTNNRNIRRPRVAQYAKDMKDGNWGLTGQAISFGEDGTLLDGQHRLEAIVMANIPVEMLVVRNAPKAVYDAGLPRSAKDQLDMWVGVKRGNAELAVARLAITINESSLKSVSAAKLNEWLNSRNPDAIHCITSQVKKTAFGRITRNAGFGLAVVSAIENGIPYKTVERFKKIITTEDVVAEKETAAIKYRNWYLQKILGGGGGKVSPTITTKAAMHCLKKFANGETIQLMKVPEGYSFPIPS